MLCYAVIEKIDACLREGNRNARIDRSRFGNIGTVSPLPLNRYVLRLCPSGRLRISALLVMYAE